MKIVDMDGSPSGPSDVRASFEGRQNESSRHLVLLTTASRRLRSSRQWFDVSRGLV